MENEVQILADVFQNYVKVCRIAYGFNPFFSYSTPIFRYKSSLKATGVHLDYITDDKLRILLENNMQGGPWFCMGNRRVERGEIKMLYEVMNNLFDSNMSQ